MTKVNGAMSAPRTEIRERIDEVDVAAWNRLAGDNPFLRHEFLAALERHGCVGERFGWLPRHIVAYDSAGELVGAVPAYLKTNSYGEFVFDWAWADAYARSGIAYYPKLVSAIPYTPATGSRLLTAPDDEATAAVLTEQALTYARDEGLSSAHWLFPDVRDRDRLQQAGFMLRADCHFHWANAGYRDFDDYLDAFTARKRKKIKRERRHVQEAGLGIEIVYGHEADDAQWRAFGEFYADTFRRKGGIATLNEAFFRDVGQALGDRVVLLFAHDSERYVAGAICFASDETLYGRHWGAVDEFDSLHFELCYYQGIDYCIRHGLARFEPGVQGEHKVSRGFLPTLTWSAHWIAHPAFHNAISDFLVRERALVERYQEELMAHSPFKTT